MLSSNHWLPSFDLVIGAFALSIWVSGALAALLVCIGVMAFRRAGAAGTTGALWRGALALVGALLTWALLSPSVVRDHVAARRALEVRTAELATRVIAPGSPLACLDAVGNATVEGACERALFASPAAVATAVAYVDAQLTLLAEGLELAARDRGYEPSLERLRRALETDRYGVVAHVLTTCGCNAADCAGLKLLRDPQRVLANLKGRTFDALVVVHAPAWHYDGPSVVPPPVASTAPSAPMAAIGPPPMTAAAPPPAAASTPPSATTGAAPSAGRYEFPSSASIPAISIMNTEPSAPPAAEPNATASPPPAPRAAAPIRRQTTREQPPNAPLPVPPPLPPSAPAPGNPSATR